MERTTRAEDAAQVRITRQYRVAPEKVWRAWTDPQALSQWFGSGQPGSVSAAEIDLREGGRYRIAFAGKRGEQHEVSGAYQEVAPHHRLVFSWAWKSTPERVSRVSLSFMASPDGTGTELVFVHDRFFDETARKNHAAGWLPMLGQLDALMQLSAQEA